MESNYYTSTLGEFDDFDKELFECISGQSYGYIKIRRQ